jgi:hypothetical protein
MGNRRLLGIPLLGEAQEHLLRQFRRDLPIPQLAREVDLQFLAMLEEKGAYVLASHGGNLSRLRIGRNSGSQAATLAWAAGCR